MSELPPGWAHASIRDLSATVTSGSRDWSRFYSERGAYFIRSAEINDYNLRLSEAIRVDLPERVEGKRSLVEKGDLLVTITGANVGKCAKVDIDVPESYVSQSVALIKLKMRGLAPLVYYGLRAPGFGAEQLANSAYGVGRPVLSLPLINAVRLPIPPEVEQSRIVAKLDTLLARVNTCRERLDKIPKLLARFRQSVLAAACSGRLTEDWRLLNPKQTSSSLDSPEELPETWTLKKNSRLAASAPSAICAGPFGTIFKARDFRAQGVPIIFLRHVRPGTYLTDKPGFMDSERWNELFTSYSVYGGELLVTKLGDPPGQCAIYPHGIGPAMVTPDVIKMSVDESGARAKYLMYFFNSPIARSKMFGLAFGVTRLRIDLTMFKALLIPLPPLPEQHEIVRRVDQLFTFADRLEARIQTARQRVDALTQSILAKAFRGELVPTEAEVAAAENRTFESAAELLERIRALNPQPGKATAGKTQTKRARKAAAARAAGA